MFNSTNKWKHYFAEAVRVAAQTDELSDMDFFDMGLEKALQTVLLEDKENEIYEAFFKERNEMFERIFGEKWNDNYFPIPDDLED